MKVIIKQVETNVGVIEMITLKSHDLCVELTTYGAAIYQIQFDNHDLLVGPKDLNTFLTSKGYYGKTIGRVSGRLVAPSYEIDEKSYKVVPSLGTKTSLHGGKVGFSFKNFEVTDEKITKEACSVSMKYVSVDGEEDFPGDLALSVKYTLNDQKDLNRV